MWWLIVGGHWWLIVRCNWWLILRGYWWLILRGYWWLILRDQWCLIVGDHWWFVVRGHWWLILRLKPLTLSIIFTFPQLFYEYFNNSTMQQNEQLPFTQNRPQDIYIYYEFSLLHIFSLVLQP
jgi:hypothetical protein